MTTLQAIGYTAVGSLAVAVTSVFFFGCAVRSRSTNIAPRCTARPKNTIYNTQPSDISQQRGGAMLGWIWWCNSIPYETLLKGIPGTGTRNGGLDGLLLKVNMDGIVLLRFQSLCLRICALVTVLCMFVILPLNLTARCNYEESPGGPVACFNWEQTNLTNYDVTTLANIPDLSDNQSAVSSLTSSQHAGTLARLYIIVLCTWIIYFATCKALYWEWKTLLALRRVYYLEKDHWAERRSELEDSLLRSRLDDEEDKRMEKRDPWIPVSLQYAPRNPFTISFLTVLDSTQSNVKLLLMFVCTQYW
jgi:Late exocytosis, associated with Golgi transport